MMNLITGLSSIGYHPGSWRHSSSWPNPIMNFERLIECAKTAERGKFDMLFLADTNATFGADDVESWTRTTLASSSQLSHSPSTTLANSRART